MTTYIGSSLVVNWAHSIGGAGTQPLHTQFHSFSYTPSVQLINQASGADLANTYLPNRKDGVCSYTALLGTGSVGVVLGSVLIEGAIGTLVVNPEGTTVGKLKLTIPAISQGAKFTFPYENLVEISCDFQQNGLRLDGTN